MKALLILLFPLNLLATPKEFSFNLFGEPYSLDPAYSRGISGGYLFNNLYRSLFRYHPEKGLIPEGAKSCKFLNPLTLVCHLDPSKKFSDGTAVEAKHYIKAFQRLVSPKTKTTQMDQLLSIKNAREILKGKTKPSTLGVLSKGKYKLVFHLAFPDKEFQYRLISPLFSPIKTDFPFTKDFKKLVNNGPFVIDQWRKGHSLTLKRNPHYKTSVKKPIQIIRVYFAEDDITAMNLYLAGKLSFLRRIKSSDILFMKKRKDFLQVPVARFDYIGFGPELKNFPHLRKALSLSLNFPELKTLYNALGTPGCPALNKKYYDTYPCLERDLGLAKQELAKVPKERLKKPIELYFSKLGGDDHAKGMQWYQNQWKINLGLNIDLKPIEQGMYLQNLRTNPPQMFRKGVGLDRPTCLAAHEVFAPGSPENYIQLEDKEYMKLLAQLVETNNPTKSKTLCRKLSQLLIDKNYVIPQGEIHFSMLLKPGYKGFLINELNQLDLTDLH